MDVFRPVLALGIPSRRLLRGGVLLLLVLALALSPSIALRTARGQTSPSDFAIQVGDAYARFDAASRTWTIGNSTIEEQWQLTTAGGLQELSLQNRTSGQTWSVSGTIVGPTVVVEGTPFDLTSGLQLMATAAAPTPEGWLQLQAQLSHPATGQWLTLEMRIVPGQPVIERHVLVTNLTAQPVQAVRLETLTMALSTPGGGLWDPATVNTGLGLHALSLQPGQSVVAEVPTLSAVPEATIPYLVISGPANGEGVLTGVRWSSNWFLGAKLGDDRLLRVDGGLHLSADGQDNIMIAPWASIEGPWSFVGLFVGDLDNAAQIIGSYMEIVNAARPAWALPLPVTWKSWYAYDRYPEEQRLLAEADLAAQLGVEVFYVDYGWAKGLGDWQPDPVRFPQGLASLADYVHAKGMRFGLWVAFGLAAADSDLLAQHPDFLARQPDPVTTGIDGAGVLCLTQAEGWLDSELERIVNDYHVDWLKFDQPMIAACTDPNHGHDPSLAGSLYANNAAFYRILNKLHADHPDLVIEDSYNGSGYLDFGTKRYSAVTWLTDDSGNVWVSMPEVQQHFYGVTYAFRPEYLVQWLASVPNAAAAIGRTTSPRDLAYQAYSGMGGAWGLSLRLTEMDQSQLALVGQLVDQYKSLRGLIDEGDFYHLTGPSPSDDPWGGGWMAVEYYQPDTGQGAALYVRNGESTPSATTVPLQGLDPQGTYQVWTLGNQAAAQTWTGQDLLTTGPTLTAEPRQGNWLIIQKTG